MSFGVCLNREGAGIVIVPTRRSDLHWDRLHAQLEHIAATEGLVDRHGEFRPVTAPTLYALLDVESEKAAAKVSAVLKDFWRNAGRVPRNSTEPVLSEIDAAFTVQHLAAVWGLKARATSRDVARKGPKHHQDVTAFDDVPDPSMSPAEYWHRLAQGEEIDKFSTIVAPINLTTLYGGLARIPGRKEVHEKAAQEYKSVYERAVLMGNPKAIDYGSAVQVDNSRNVFFSRQDNAEAAFNAAVKALGIIRSAVVNPIVLYDESVSAVARRRHGSDGGQARKRVTDELKEGLDLLAVHFQLVGRASAGTRLTGWLEERLPLDLPVESEVTA